MGKRVTVGILEKHHKELLDLCEVTGQKVVALVDRAMENMLRDEAPVWRRAAEQIQKKPKKL